MLNYFSFVSFAHAVTCIDYCTMHKQSGSWEPFYCTTLARPGPTWRGVHENIPRGQATV